MKFENIDTEENNYIIVRYMSEVYADINVFIKILFDSDYRDVNVDSGYGEYEFHSSELLTFYYADNFELDSITDEYGEDISLEPNDIDRVYREAKAIYELYFDGDDYDDIINSLEKGKYKSGGKVGRVTKIKEDDYFLTLEGYRRHPQLKRFRVRYINGNDVTIMYSTTKSNIEELWDKEDIEYLLEKGHIKKTNEKEYWKDKYENKSKYAKGGGLESREKINSIFANPQKFMPFDGRFLYPPRIESKLQPISVSRFDNNQFIAQPKLNGSNTSVSISEHIAVPKERHNRFFANPPKFDFKALHRGKGFMCLTGEFMNKSKKDETGKPFRGFCIWDIVAYEGKILIGSTIEERIKLLDMLYPSKGAISSKGITYLHKTEVPDIYKVANFDSDFSKIYNELSKVDMVEGFVLKRKNGKLEMMLREQNNTGWAVKVRKPTANYMF